MQYSTIISLIGLSLVPIGALTPVGNKQKTLFLVSGILMLIAAALERSYYYIALELVITGACIIAFIKLPKVIQAVVPIVLCIIAVYWLSINQPIDSNLQIFGVLGLALLSLGYATSMHLFYFAGTLIILLFSAIKYWNTQELLALMFTVLNFIAAVAIIIGWHRHRQAHKLSHNTNLDKTT